MKVICIPRAFGKTVMAIRRAIEKGATLVVWGNHFRVGTIKDIAVKLFGDAADDLEVITWNDFVSGNYGHGKNNPSVVIDDLDVILNRIAMKNSAKVDMVTVNLELD